MMSFVHFNIHISVGHKERMGSDYNVKTGWETGAVSVEPLDFLAKDIPVDLATYAKKHDLLEKEGWKRFRRIANRDQHLQRLVKQAKLRSFRVSPKYKYGYSIPQRTEWKYQVARCKQIGTWTVI
jgi:hypothetical protein